MKLHFLLLLFAAIATTSSAQCCVGTGGNLCNKILFARAYSLKSSFEFHRHSTARPSRLPEIARGLLVKYLGIADRLPCGFQLLEVQVRDWHSDHLQPSMHDAIAHTNLHGRSQSVLTQHGVQRPQKRRIHARVWKDAVFCCVDLGTLQPVNLN